MFDPKEKQIIPIRVEGGTAVAVMSFPSDNQWAEWRSRKKIKQKDLGRRSVQMQAQEPGSMDLKLFREIFDADGTAKEAESSSDLAYSIPADQQDAAEDAMYFINRLARCRVVDEPVREGDVFTINLKVPGGHTTTHRLREPTAREQFRYERAAAETRYGQFGVSEMIINFRAASDLYDKLVQKPVEGYVGDAIPMPHKAEAIAVLMAEIRPVDEADDPE